MNTVAWSASTCAIGYDAIRKVLWCWNLSVVYFFSMKTMTWVGVGDIASIPVSNTVMGPDNLTFYRHSGGRKYLGKSISTSDGNRNILLETGKISCGNIARRKKFYRVYITALNGANVKTSVQTDLYNTDWSASVDSDGLANGENAIDLTSVKGKYIVIRIEDVSTNANSNLEIGDISVIFRERNLK